MTLVMQACNQFMDAISLRYIYTYCALQPQGSSKTRKVDCHGLTSCTAKPLHFRHFDRQPIFFSWVVQILARIHSDKWYFNKLFNFSEHMKKLQQTESSIHAYNNVLLIVQFLLEHRFNYISYKQFTSGLTHFVS